MEGVEGGGAGGERRRGQPGRHTRYNRASGVASVPVARHAGVVWRRREPFAVASPASAVRLRCLCSYSHPPTHLRHRLERVVVGEVGVKDGAQQVVFLRQWGGVGGGGVGVGRAGWAGVATRPSTSVPTLRTRTRTRRQHSHVPDGRQKEPAWLPTQPCHPRLLPHPLPTLVRGGCTGKRSKRVSHMSSVTTCVWQARWGWGRYARGLVGFKVSRARQKRRRLHHLWWRQRRRSQQQRQRHRPQLQPAAAAAEAAARPAGPPTHLCRVLLEAVHPVVAHAVAELLLLAEQHFVRQVGVVGLVKGLRAGWWVGVWVAAWVYHDIVAHACSACGNTHASTASCMHLEQCVTVVHACKRARRTTRQAPPPLSHTNLAQNVLFQLGVHAVGLHRQVGHLVGGVNVHRHLRTGNERNRGNR